MAFLQDTRREPMFKAPAVVLVLIALLIAAHVARVWLLPQNLAEKIVTDYGFVPLHVTGPGSLLARAVPFVSHIFLHIDWVHLTLNCVWLLAFGSVVARRYGPSAFLLFFFLCGVAAAVTHLAFHWRDDQVAIGASGAISGLMAAGIRMLRQPQQTSALVPILSSQVLVFTAIWVAINLAAGFLGFVFFGPDQQIAWEGHLGGYFAGLLLSGPFDRLVGLDRVGSDPT